MSLPDAAAADRRNPENCPCLSGERYALCCGRYHAGEASAPTAEALMRSRYSAFALGLADYLLETWHPGTRPASLDLDPAMRWVRLDIAQTRAGGSFDTEGTVAFRAHYRVADESPLRVDAGRAPSSAAGQRGVLEELSRFVREGGRWYYVDGEVRE